ncbi:MAG TPA: TMEM175 family protein [Chitinophagaceae bacterium]|nr:TMEM175 family protein [Chitinophagaceae bacterium]
MNKVRTFAHDRRQFQVDRITFYSDAVMAIASTMLILEFKIPPLGKDSTWMQIRTEYSGKLFIPVMGLLVSFFSISRLWIKHHELFEHVVNYHRALLVLNQCFLFLIMLLPLSTSFMLEDNNPKFLRFFTYFVNLGLCNLSYYFLLRMVMHRKSSLSTLTPDDHQAVKSKRFAMFLAVSFLGGGFISLISVKYFYLPFIPLGVYRIYRDISYLMRRLKSMKKAQLSNI